LAKDTSRVKVDTRKIKGPMGIEVSESFSEREIPAKEKKLGKTACPAAWADGRKSKQKIKD